MGFLDKAKAAAEQAAARAKEGVDDVQTKRELGQSYTELGKTAFELVEAGEIAHPRLTTTVERIRVLAAKAAGEGSGSGGASASDRAAGAGEPPPPAS